MATGPWRPAKLSGSGPEKHVVNQNFRELNARIDNLAKTPLRRVGTPRNVLNFGTIGAQSGVERVINIQGAEQGGVAHVNPQVSLGSTALHWNAWVTGKNQVTVRVVNPTGGSLAVPTIPWSVVVL